MGISVKSLPPELRKPKEENVQSVRARWSREHTHKLNVSKAHRNSQKLKQHAQACTSLHQVLCVHII